jgi:cell division protease FtsH
MIDQAHDEALEILQEYRSKLDQMAALLIERETIDKEEVARLLTDVPKRAQRDQAVRGAGLAVSRRAVRAQREQGPKPLG